MRDTCSMNRIPVVLSRPFQMLVFDSVVAFPAGIQQSIRENQMELDFRNGSQFKILGCDNFNAFRGGNPSNLEGCFGTPSYCSIIPSRAVPPVRTEAAAGAA